MVVLCVHSIVVIVCILLCFLRVRSPPRFTLTDTLLPFPTLFRSRDRTTLRRCSTGTSNPCGPARIDVALPFAALRLHATRLVHEFKRGDHQCDTCLQSCC